MTDDDNEILEILSAPSHRVPTQKPTNFVKSIVLNVRTNELPCGWEGCGVLTQYRVWGLARCRQHLIEDVENELDGV